MADLIYQFGRTILEGIDIQRESSRVAPMEIRPEAPQITTAQRVEMPQLPGGSYQEHTGLQVVFLTPFIFKTQVSTVRGVPLTPIR